MLRRTVSTLLHQVTGVVWLFRIRLAAMSSVGHVVVGHVVVGHLVVGHVVVGHLVVGHLVVGHRGCVLGGGAGDGIVGVTSTGGESENGGDRQGGGTGTHHVPPGNRVCCVAP